MPHLTGLIGVRSPCALHPVEHPTTSCARMGGNTMTGVTTTMTTAAMTTTAVLKTTTTTTTATGRRAMTMVMHMVAFSTMSMTISTALQLRTITISTGTNITPDTDDAASGASTDALRCLQEAAAALRHQSVAQGAALRRTQAMHVLQLPKLVVDRLIAVHLLGQGHCVLPQVVLAQCSYTHCFHQ